MKRTLSFLMILTLFLIACRLMSTIVSTATPYPTYTPMPTNTPFLTNTPLPTNTSVPTNTPVPTEQPMDGPKPTPAYKFDQIKVVNEMVYLCFDKGLIMPRIKDIIKGANKIFTSTTLIYYDYKNAKIIIDFTTEPPTETIRCVAHYTDGKLPDTLEGITLYEMP